MIGDPLCCLLTNCFFYVFSYFNHNVNTLDMDGADNADNADDADSADDADADADDSDNADHADIANNASGADYEENNVKSEDSFSVDQHPGELHNLSQCFFLV